MRDTRLTLAQKGMAILQTIVALEITNIWPTKNIPPYSILAMENAASDNGNFHEAIWKVP